MTSPKLLIVTPCLFLLSCASLKYPEREDLKPLKNDVSMLNGSYRNISRDSGFSKTSLWSVLTKPNKSSSFSGHYNDSNTYVRLTAISKKKITAQLYKYDILVEEKVIKGKLKGNYFSIKRKVHYLGLPFTYLSYAEYKLQLGKNKSNDLYVDGAAGWFTWIVIVSAGTWNDYNFKYRSD